MNLEVIKVKFLYFIVRLLPKKVVHYCFMSVMAYATMCKCGSTIVPELTGMDAIKRYVDDYKI